MRNFAQFASVFPAQDSFERSLDGRGLAESVLDSFGIRVPDALVTFWNEMGCGYFGHRELYFFGEEASDSPRDSLISWNSQDYWGKLFPKPSDGGPFFFAETSFGRQLGFIVESGREIAYLLDTDVMMSYHIADPFEDVFTKVLSRRFSVTNQDLYFAVKERLGVQPQGMHYSPIVSLLVGGSFVADNYMITTPNAHMRETLAAFESRE